MPSRRERWLKYHAHPVGCEIRLGPWGTLLWPNVLKAAHRGDGLISIRRPGQHLAQLSLLVRPRDATDRRILKSGYAELVDAGLVVAKDEGLAIAGWSKHRPRRPNVVRPDIMPGEPEWLRLVTDESTAFAEMSLGARGLAACIMRIADADGCFASSTEALLRRLGWQPREFPALLRFGLLHGWLDELVASGHVVARGPFMAIASWDRSAIDDRLKYAKSATFEGRISEPGAIGPDAIQLRSTIDSSTRNQPLSRGEYSITAFSTDAIEVGSKWDRSAIEMRSTIDLNARSSSTLRDMTGSDLIGDPDPPYNPPADGGMVFAESLSASGTPEPESAETRSPEQPETQSQPSPERPTSPPLLHAGARSGPGGGLVLLPTVPGAPRRGESLGGISQRRAASGRTRILAPEHYPEWFEAMWRVYQGRGGWKGHKAPAYAEAMALAPKLAGPEALRDRVLAALEWQQQLPDWKRGIGVPDFERYLRKAMFASEKPGAEAFVERPIAPSNGAAETPRKSWDQIAAEEAAKEKRAADLAAKRRLEETERRDREEQERLARLDAELERSNAEAAEQLQHCRELLEAWKRGERTEEPYPLGTSENQRRVWRDFMFREAVPAFEKAGIAALAQCPRWAREWRSVNPVDRPTSGIPPRPVAVRPTEPPRAAIESSAHPILRHLVADLGEPRLPAAGLAPRTRPMVVSVDGGVRIA